MIIEREQISFHHICGLLLDHDTLTLSLQLKPISFFEESLQNTTAPPLQLCFNKNSSINAHGKGFLEGWWQAIHALILLLIIAGCLVGHILICKMLCDGFILIHYFWFTFSFMTFLFFFLCLISIYNSSFIHGLLCCDIATFVIFITKHDIIYLSFNTRGHEHQ